MAAAAAEATAAWEGGGHWTPITVLPAEAQSGTRPQDNRLWRRCMVMSPTLSRR